MKKPDVNKRLKVFDDNISANIANNNIIANSEDPPEGWHLDADYIDDPQLANDPESKITDTDYYTEEALDKYLIAWVLFTDGESELMGTVKQRKRDAHCNLLEVSRSNPILDTRQYKVHFMMDKSKNINLR